MEDTLLIDAAERFVKGEMSKEEVTFFEELRKNNPDIDQLVVEQIFFLNELDKYAATKNFRHSLHETEAKLISENFIKRNPKPNKAKVVTLWKKYRSVVAVAASLAGIICLFIAILVSRISTEKQNNIKPLVEILKQQETKTRQIEKKVNELAKASNVAPIKPRVEATFRATGFMIDAGNNFIITNAHVVNKAHNQLIIENKKGEQFSAQAVYVNTETDLAIIKVIDNDFKHLSALPYSIRKKGAELGEQVFMLGFPKQEIVYGEGYISAKNGYEMDSIYFQMSTTANEGNSGSPVINKNGELLGIITSTETNAQGVVFALKSSNIYKAVEELNKTKEYPTIRFTSAASLRGADRPAQIKKLEDYVFMIKGN